MSYLAIISCLFVQKFITTEGFGQGLFINLLGAVLFLVFYELIIKRSWHFLSNLRFRGKYIHCTKEYKEVKTDGNTHTSRIKTKFLYPNVLFLTSDDYTKSKHRIWKGKIKIDPQTKTYGFGTYKYEGEDSAGIHDILMIDKETILFQLSYLKESGHSYLMVKERSRKIIQA